MRPHLRVAGEAGEFVPTTDQFGVAMSDFLRCGECGHLQLAEMPEVEHLYEDAASEDYEAEEEGQRATARAELARVERHAPGRGRLLDFGCWVGFLASEAGARGWQPVGVEPSRWAAERARSRGVEVVDEADLGLASFEAVTMGDVIEHLPDPGATLDRLHALLAPGGVVWIATPDAGSRVARALGRRWRGDWCGWRGWRVSRRASGRRTSGTASRWSRGVWGRCVPCGPLAVVQARGSSAITG